METPVCPLSRLSSSFMPHAERNSSWWRCRRFSVIYRGHTKRSTIVAGVGDYQSQIWGPNATGGIWTQWSSLPLPYQSEIRGRFTRHIQVLASEYSLRGYNLPQSHCVVDMAEMLSSAWTSRHLVRNFASKFFHSRSRRWLFPASTHVWL